MARTALTWPNAQMRLIVTGIEQCNRAFPTDNPRFLDAVIDEIRVVTGRLYGAKTYARLIDAVPASMAVTRRPSVTTIQKAIERAQALAPAALPADEDVPASPALDVHSLRRAVEPVVRDAIGPLHALLAQLLATGSSLDSVVGGIPSNDQALQARLTQTSLEDAHARVRRLEEENGRLRRESGRAEARATIAESRITQLLEQLHQAFSHSAVGADTLAKAAKRLDGTEQFLKMQNDAVRLQATAEAETLRRQVKQLREQVDHLQLDNDQYRRALLSRPDENARPA
jgi:DNA repair exonuclease SbcCD ATPase subunit